MSPARVVADKKPLPSLQCLVCSQLHTMETLTEGGRNGTQEKAAPPDQRIYHRPPMRLEGWRRGRISVGRQSGHPEDASPSRPRVGVSVQDLENCLER